MFKQLKNVAYSIGEGSRFLKSGFGQTDAFLRSINEQTKGVAGKIVKYAPVLQEVGSTYKLIKDTGLKAAEKGEQIASRLQGVKSYQGIARGFGVEPEYKKISEIAQVSKELFKDIKGSRYKEALEDVRTGFGKAKELEKIIRPKADDLGFI